MKEFFQKRWIPVLVAALVLAGTAGLAISPELQTAIIEFYKALVEAVGGVS